MTRKFLAATMVLAVGLSGCLGASGPAETVDPSAATDLLPQEPMLPEGIPAALVQHSCTEMLGLYPIPMAEARMGLPEGFEPVAFDDAGLTGLMVGVGYTCMHAESGSDHYGGEDFGILMGAVAVEPPEHYKVEGYQHHMVTMGLFTTDADLHAMYTAWGVTGASATDNWDWFVQGAGPARVGTASATSDGFTVEVLTAAAGASITQAAGKTRWFNVADGEVTGAMDLFWNESDGIEMGFSAVKISDGMPVGFPPAMPGIGGHFWGEDYAYELAYVPADELMAEHMDGEEHEHLVSGVALPAPASFRGLRLA